MILRSFPAILYSSILILSLSFSSNTVRSAVVDFTQCYDTDGSPLRCEPEAETFSLRKTPSVSSTCGIPSVDYCRRNEIELLCGLTCNEGDHPASYMTDFFIQLPLRQRTWWQSESNLTQPVYINISLDARVQIQTVKFEFVSLKPDSFYIRKSNNTDGTIDYKDFHYFSRNCRTEYGMNPSLPRLVSANETAILCQNIASFLPGQINFVPTLDRPSSTDSRIGLSDALYNFTTATHIQVILRNFSTEAQGNFSELYHAIEDLSVVGKCQCYGHANVCIVNNDNTRSCDCMHNTAGDYCDRCADTYVDVPWRAANGTHPFECQSCNCSDYASQCVFDQALYEATGSGGVCVNCTGNRMGPHCEECMDGFTRSNDSCVPCECNGKAVVCDKEYGTCINCSGNTEGDMCQYCIEGHYDTVDGECVPCPCPLNTTDGQYSPSCTLMNDGRVICDNCSLGHIGDHCERCGPGYYGDPMGIHTGNSTPCKRCPCNDNINSTDPLACHNVTGLCQECLFNTTGPMCEECLPGYYGDPIYTKNCTDCSCYSEGSVNSSCSGIGQCYCLPNVEGMKCTHCTNGYHNISSGLGCDRCDCHINGSTSVQCNLITGVCTCKAGVTGDKCDTCELGYYGLNIDGCKFCECNDQAISCTDDPVYSCINCSSDRTGPYCEECTTFYYPQLNLPVNSTHYCQECSCHLEGVIDNGDCNRNSNESAIGQCYCKLNVEGRNCSVCKDGYFNLQDSNLDGCQECGCNANLSLSQSCDPDGTCTCKPFVIGSKCNNCTSGYYYTEGTCEKCGCDLGGALSNECQDITGQCYCRRGITGIKCTEVIPGYFYPYIDHYTLEAEDSTGLLNLSYRLPNSSDLFTGAGYAIIRNTTQVIHFGSFIPSVSGRYYLVIRYSLMNQWQSAALKITTVSTGPSPPVSCMESSGDLVYTGWTMGMGQAIAESACLRGGSNYTFSLNGYVFTQPSQIEIDSLVIQLISGDDLVTLNDNAIREQYMSCVNLMGHLSTRNASVLAQCREVSFAVLSEAHNGTLRCNCSVQGTLSGTQCQPYGGQCTCTEGFIGRACDSCAAGHYSAVFGCPRCSCDSNGAIDPQFCDRISGQCYCHPNVNGSQCDACTPYHYNITSRRGCDHCGCDTNGSVSLQCDQVTGTCTCKGGVVGDKCQRCDDEMYGFPNCRPCNCNQDGSLNNNCHLSTGQCDCHANTMGRTCDTCISGTFNLHSSNPNGCQPCYCSGLTDNCTSANGYTYATITTDFTDSGNDGWSIQGNGANLNSEGLVVIPTEGRLIAPGKYLGNKLSSYVQFMELNLTINGDPISSDYDIAIMSNNITLFSVYREVLVTGNQILSVQLHESYWFTSDGSLPSSYLFQSILIDLTGLYIRANLSSDGSTVFHTVSLDSAIYGRGNGEEIGLVEQCICPSKAYTGLSCEECMDGFTRSNDSCVPCECNGKAVVCDKEYGTCINCTGNTEGEMCQYCIEGHYDTVDGECVPCPCPLNTTDGQYSPSCTLMNDGKVICDNCSLGHIGDHCERCGPGYYGDPTGAKTGNSTPCSDCMCNGNIDLTDPLACSMTTGLCQECLFNTTGPMCEECLPGYYGDPIDAKNCTDCSCYSTGSVNSSCSDIGQCYCLPNVEGMKCTHCSNGYYNISSGLGCDRCDCHINGSTSVQCNLITGVCTCKAGVTGDKCDTCELGYYGLNIDGCKSCNCSIGAVSVQCNEGGVCVCKPGVTGVKCDVCMEENTFQNTTTGLCDNCSSCYDDLKTDVDALHSHYQSTRSKVNQVAGRNDPTTTFERKQLYAMQLVNDLYLKVLSLNNTYTNYTLMTNNVTVDTLERDVNNTMTQIRVMLEGRASTIITFSIVSEDIVTQIREELYKSLSFLIQLRNLTQRVGNYSETVSNNTDIGREKLQLGIQLIDEFESQLVNLSSQAMRAMVQANDSLFLAMDLVSDYQITLQEIIVLERRVNEVFINHSSLNASLSQLLQLSSPSGNISHGLNAINASLMSLIVPDLQLLMSNLSVLEQREVTLHSQTLQLTQTLTDLINDLSLYSMWYNAIERHLNQTLADIQYYSTLLNEAYQEAISAHDSANTCIRNGERVLEQLVSFNETISNLRANTNSVLFMVVWIEEESDRVHEIVINATQSIDDISTRVTTGLSQARQLLNFTKDLEKVANELHTNSTSLLTQTRTHSNLTTAVISNSTQILQDSNDTLQLINDLSTNVSTVSDLLNDPTISALPESAAKIRLNASVTFSSLVQLLLATPTPDESLIDEIEAYINTISTQFNTTDILAMTQYFEAQLVNPIEEELISLRAELQSMEREVMKLRDVLNSLPNVDCN